VNRPAGIGQADEFRTLQDPIGFFKKKKRTGVTTSGCRLTCRIQKSAASTGQAGAALGPAAVQHQAPGLGGHAFSKSMIAYTP
jgi:hypothetical protein